MTRPALRVALGVLGLLVGGLAVLALREATLSTHEPVAPDSTTELVVTARTRSGEQGQTLAEMVEAVLMACRLEVSSDFVGAIRGESDNRFRAVMRPALDPTNRRQFRGCVEDWTVDHVRIDVVTLVSAA